MFKSKKIKVYLFIQSISFLFGNLVLDEVLQNKRVKSESSCKIIIKTLQFAIIKIIENLMKNIKIKLKFAGEFTWRPLLFSFLVQYSTHDEKNQ